MIHPDDTYDGGRLCPDVTTVRGGHHPECCCPRCDPYDDGADAMPSGETAAEWSAALDARLSREDPPF